MKTISQEKEQSFDNFAISCAIASAPIDEYKIPFECGFDSGAAFAQRWIPVEEELPEKQGHYLVKVRNSFPKNCNVIVCEFYDDNKTFYCEWSDSPIKDAISWRPLNYEL